MLDVSIIILLLIFTIYTGFISRYSIIHHFTIKMLMIIGIIILQFIVDKYAYVYMIVLGTMLLIPYDNIVKEYFENNDDNKDTADTKETKKSNDKKNKKKKDSKDDKDDDEKSGGLFGKKKKDDKDDKDDKDGKNGKNKKPIIPKNTIPPKCANQKIKILIPENITIETEKMMTCKTITDTCFPLLDSTKQNDMCSTTPKKSFFSTKPVEPIPSNKKDMLSVDNCGDYLSKCTKDGDSVYPGEAQCKNISTAGSNEGI